MAKLLGAKHYLEIGVQKGETFLNVDVEFKDGVDPKFQFDTTSIESTNVRLFQETSDLFFGSHADKRYDLILIDGLHTFEQTFRDFCSSLSFAHDKTVFVIDDTVPNSIFSAHRDVGEAFRVRKASGIEDGSWHGDVFKMVPALHDFFPALNYATIVDGSNPQTLVWKEPRIEFRPKYNNIESIERLSYFDFLKIHEIYKIVRSEQQALETIVSAVLRRSKPSVKLPQTNGRARRLVVVRRQSLDWSALARGEGTHDTESFDAMQGRPAGTTASLMKLWNDSFSVGFYAVRQKMKDIAEKAVLAMQDADVVELNQLTENFDAEALYVFTDDDDWFSPDLAKILLASEAGVADAGVWTSTAFENGALHERANDKLFCYTNNYVLHGAFLKRVPRTAWLSLRQITQHGWAEGAVHNPTVNLVRIPGMLSITNKHPCAFTVLEHAQTRNKKIRDIVASYGSLLRVDRQAFEEKSQALLWAYERMDEVSRFLVAI